MSVLKKGAWLEILKYASGICSYALCSQLVSPKMALYDATTANASEEFVLQRQCFTFWQISAEMPFLHSFQDNVSRTWVPVEFVVGSQLHVYPVEHLYASVDGEFKPEEESSQNYSPRSI